MLLHFEFVNELFIVSLVFTNWHVSFHQAKIWSQLLHQVLISIWFISLLWVLPRLRSRSWSWPALIFAVSLFLFARLPSWSYLLLLCRIGAGDAGYFQRLKFTKSRVKRCIMKMIVQLLSHIMVMNELRRRILSLFKVLWNEWVHRFSTFHLVLKFKNII